MSSEVALLAVSPLSVFSHHTMRLDISVTFGRTFWCNKDDNATADPSGYLPALLLGGTFCFGFPALCRCFVECFVHCFAFVLGLVVLVVDKPPSNVLLFRTHRNSFPGDGIPPEDVRLSHNICK